jgi:hypothetical protein
MCWALNHQNILEMAQGHISLSITPEEAKAGSIRTGASAEDEADYHVAKDTIEGPDFRLWRTSINIKPK